MPQTSSSSALAPVQLPSVARARLPENYVAAKAALACCDRVDECQDWADKAAALASYAKQAEDDALYRTAVRIQARAIARAGELLKQIAPNVGGRPAKNTGRKTRGSAPPSSRSGAARTAGMSRDQKRTALRVASVPAKVRERLIESDDPPTVTALAKMGTKPRPIDVLHGRDPKDFTVATAAMALIRPLAVAVDDLDAARVVRGMSKQERTQAITHVDAVLRWLAELRKELQ